MLCSSTENYSGETYKPASQKNKQTKKTLNLFNLKKKKGGVFQPWGLGLMWGCLDFKWGHLKCLVIV